MLRCDMIGLCNTRKRLKNKQPYDIKESRSNSQSSATESQVIISIAEFCREVSKLNYRTQKLSIIKT